jgi:hypothetical protein
MILPCNCPHPAQDYIHGKGRRVHNVGKLALICTVCKDKKAMTAQQIKDNNPSKKSK